MRILTASVTNAPSEILRAHLQTIAWQQLPPSVEVDLCYIADPALSENSLSALEEAGARVLHAEPKPAGAEYAVDSVTHRWTKPTFGWLAREKQRLLNLARQERYDAIWLVDSDLLCAPDTLASLIACEKPVVSAVFWTRWTPDAPPLPQVWLSHPYEFQGKGYEAHEFLGHLADRRLVRVGGLGACTLISTTVLDRVAYWPLVEGLPEHSMWQGEDRHFCIRAERAHVELWADAWPDVWHCYRPEDTQRIPQMLATLSTRPPMNGETPNCIGRPAVGDLISFTLEPCEEPALAGHKEHIRGRLGQLRLLPDIERALTSMKVGDERFIRARFPLWYPIPQYRGRDLTLRVKLLGVKPFSLPPTLSESAYAEDGLLAFDSLYAA